MKNLAVALFGLVINAFILWPLVDSFYHSIPRLRKVFYIVVTLLAFVMFNYVYFIFFYPDYLQFLNY